MASPRHAVAGRTRLPVAVLQAHYPIVVAIVLLLVCVVAASAVADPPTQPPLESAQEVIEGQAPEAEVPPLTDPEAAAELPHADLNRSEALELLEQTFGPVLQAAAGPFAELEVKEFLSNNVAVITPGNQPKSEEGESQGQATLLDSTIPLRAPNESGEEEQVDLGLQSSGGALEAENGLVEAALPTELGEGVELPEAEVGIEVEGAAQERSASTTEESVAFYPNVATDSDLALALTPTGVESLTQLRTADAPTSQTFHLSLPAGAELIATKAGGAEVVEGARTLVTIPVPSALDADGNTVPVQLEVSGDSLTLEATPGSNAAFPILVDPIFETYTWGGNTTAGLGDWTGEHTLASPFLQASKASCTSWCSGFIPDGRPGLWVSAAAGWNDAPGWAGGFHYLIPRWQSDWNAINQSPTSYIAAAHYYGPGFWLREDHNASPYVVAGLWWPEHAEWLSSHSHGGNEGNLYMNEIWNFPGKSGAKEAAFGLVSSDSHNLSSGREAYIGYITIELTDENTPEPGNIGSSTQWVNNQPTSTIPFSFTDLGLGVYSVTVSDKAGHSWKTLAGCSGGAGNPCPRVWTSTDTGRPPLTYDPSVLPQGINFLELVAADPVGHQSNQALGEIPAVPVNIQVKVDHTPPALALSGTLTEQAKLGVNRPTYTLKLNATDGTEAAPQSGVVKTVVEVDGKVVDEKSQGCITKNCAISREVPIEASKYAAGQHTLKVTAEDGVKLSTTKALTFELEPTPPPSVMLSGTMTEQPTIGTTRPRYKLHVKAIAEGGELIPSAYSSSIGSSGTGESQFSHPAGMAVDSNGFLWAIDENNNRIEKFGENGQYVTKFGSLGTASGKFTRPTDIAFAPSGKFWVTDSNNNRVQEFNASHVYLTQFGTAGSGNGQLAEPEGVAVDVKGNVWVADTHNARLQEFNEAGEFIKVAGSKGELGEPTGIDIGIDGEIWVADRGQNRVVEFNKAGEYVAQFGTEGTGRRQFVHPDAIEVDVEGNVWVGDEGNDRVQELNSEGKYIAQFGSEGSGAGQFSLLGQIGMATDAKGGIWIADAGNNRLQRWQIPSYVPTAAGSFGSSGSGEGQLYVPAGMARDLQGNIWVADLENSRLEEFSEAGEYLGSVGSFGSGNGQLNRPTDVAIDAKGNIWVADGDNCRVEEFSESGKYLAKFSDSETAPPSCRRAEGIAVDNNGHIWVTDSYFSQLKEFDEAGKLLKVIGTKGTGEGQLYYPIGIAIGLGGNIWTSDQHNNRILEFTPEGSLVAQFGSEGTTSGKFKHPSGLDIDERGNVWVVDEMNNRVQEFNHNGQYVAQFGSHGSEPGQFSFSWPSGILADSKGNLWVSDGQNGRIQKWNYGNTSSEITTEVTVEGKNVESGKTSCIGSTCPLGTEWTLESPTYIGKHTVQVKATDGLGRSTTKTLSVEVQHDTTQPTVELSGALANAPEGWVEQKSYGLTASASDQGGGVTSLAVKIDGNTIASESQGCAEGGCTESMTKSPNMANYAGGAHSAEVIAADGAGNTTTKHWTINVDPEGHISTIEAEDTLEAVEETSNANPIGPPQKETEYYGTTPGLGVIESEGNLMTAGGKVPTTIAKKPSAGLTMEVPLDGAFSAPCEEESKSAQEESEQGEQTPESEESEPSGSICKLPEESSIGTTLESIHVVPLDTSESASSNTVVDENATVATNTTDDVDTIVRPLYEGAMTFEAIRDATAPQAYSWEVNLEEDQELKLVDNRHAVVYWTGGPPAFGITAGSAHDAVGTSVPTTLKVSEGNIITLNVEHHAGAYVYPVLSGVALQGGYTEAIIEGPPEEEEESTVIEESGTTMVVHIAAVGPPIAEASAAEDPGPGGQSVYTMTHKFKFNQCRYNAQYDPSSVPIPEMRREATKSCEKNVEGPTHIHLIAAMAVHGWYHDNQATNWVWISRGNLQCDKWGAQEPAMVNCEKRPLKPSHENVHVLGDYRFPPLKGNFYANPIAAACDTVRGRLEVGPTPHEEEAVISPARVGEACSWP